MNTALTSKTTNTRRIDWWIYTVPVLAMFILVSYLIVQSRPGGLTGVLIFYLAPFFTAILAVIFLLTGIILSFRKRPFFNRWRIAGFSGLFLLCFSGAVFNKYPSSYDDKPSKVAFRLPLDSAITVAWGGATKRTNYHVRAPDQRWAYDLLITKNGKSHTGDGKRAENYYCYGLSVLSPAAGKVVATFGSDPDMPIGKLGGGTDPVGNHIILEVAPGEYLFICHLKPGSIKVKAGDMVIQGQELAGVGNSGNTSEPHIHLHLQDTKEFGIGEGIPFYFHHYSVNGKLVAKGIPTGGVDGRGIFTGQIIQHIPSR